ncbi:Uncharacterized protein YabR [Symbiodinium microadriaticum]|uniref:Uncharacterized protein YabR n=1 Tax=Symbiodinium microadriaticum TaxID=2951 RepID=A0A1Q9DI51_SYMMI|nr:Uncharacterized protein YabR [Symbiodinium microadriaticum]
MAVVVPSTPAEHERARMRSPVLLVADRVVRPVTRSNREKLATAFDTWLSENHGVLLKDLLNGAGDVSEKVANFLVAYGQALFRGGQPYYKYSETINAVAALEPSIRRSLTYAWDLAFAWLSEEPRCHHKAMPLGILLAVLSAALAWGWAAEAAVFSLAWTGLLRPGEVLSARRSDLILPRDSAPGTKHALLVIRNPKTRGRAARHQSARVDPADIIELLDAVFGNLPGHVSLWPQSCATLRRRLEQIQERLGLVEAGKPVFDLSSFRSGGATWALSVTENSELVRRRGRWLSLRVMDIYLQEVVAITYLPSLEPHTRACIDSLAAEFSAILRRVIFFMARGIPRAAWFAPAAFFLSNCRKWVELGFWLASAKDDLDSTAARALQDEDERSAEPAQPYHEMKVVDLREALRALGMPVSGRKPELVARLEAAGKEETSPAHFSEKSSDTDDVDVLEPGQVSLSDLRVGQKLRGIVRRISQWGAFVEIGPGATALARISRMVERYVEDVFDVVSVGQEVVVWVYRVAPDGKVGLSMIEYPTSKLKDPVSFFEDARPSEWFTATVRFISNWSIFVDVAVPEGGGLVQGILHKSQFPHPEKAVKGQEVEVRVVEIISNTGTLRLTAMRRGSRPSPHVALPAVHLEAIPAVQEFEDKQGQQQALMELG